jgi:hypothetical protein
MHGKEEKTMDDVGNTNVEITNAKDTASELLTSALNDLRNTCKVEEGEEPRLFFPNGIELISITLSVSKISLEFKVAGAAGISGLMNSGGIGLGHPRELDEEVIEEQETTL